MISTQRNRKRQDQDGFPNSSSVSFRSLVGRTCLSYQAAVCKEVRPDRQREGRERGGGEEGEGESVCVCVCERERGEGVGERESVCVYVWVCLCVCERERERCVWVRERERERERECEREREIVRERERERVKEGGERERQRESFFHHVALCQRPQIIALLLFLLLHVVCWNQDDFPLNTVRLSWQRVCFPLVCPLGTERHVLNHFVVVSPPGQVR